MTLFASVSVLAHGIDGAAQGPLNFEIAFRSGLPFTNVLSSRLTGAASAFSSTSSVKPGFSVGPTFGVVVHDQITIEFDAIYKPIRLFGSSRTGPTLQSLSTTRGSSWEFPLLVNYRFFRRPIRPFGGGGIIVGATVDGTTDTRTVDLQTGVESASTGPFRGSIENLGPALVVNGGLEWRNSRFLIRPEFRYARRPDATRNTFLFRSPNQFEYLIGFSFLGRSVPVIR